LTWGTSTSDYWHEVALASLPSSSELWLAQDEHSWEALLPTSTRNTNMRFHDLFRLACDPATRVENRPEFRNQWVSSQ
jgi:hypothetical protein